MTPLIASMGKILAAFASFDAWTISDALGGDGAWVLGLVATLGGGAVAWGLYRLVPWLERNLERTVMVVSYLLIATIIFVEVIRRFVFSVQEPWSTTLPPFLFLIMTWAGCTYNVRRRSHLSFNEFRANMPRGPQFACLVLDAILWIGFAWVVVVTSTRMTANSAANFQIMLGTDNVMQWWLLIFVPVSFILLAGRAMENLAEDWNNYRSGAPLIGDMAIVGD